LQALVSGQFLNTSFAGPRYIRATQQPAAGSTAAAAAAAAASPSTWWQLDLGPQHRLLCNYYTIRHDGSQDGFVRSWVLQVSRNLLGLQSASGPLAAEHAYFHSALLLRYCWGALTSLQLLLYHCKIIHHLAVKRHPSLHMQQTCAGALWWHPWWLKAAVSAVLLCTQCTGLQ
jgi:hypothetical protein